MKLLHAVENGSWWKAQGAGPTGRESLEVKILNTKSHFWFGSWWNSEPKKVENVGAHVQKKKKKNENEDRFWQGGQRASVGGLGRWEEARWAQRLVWRSVTMMRRCSAAAKMDWPELGLIKSLGWCCRSAVIINTEMMMMMMMMVAERLGSAVPDQFTPTVYSWWPICILAELSREHIPHTYVWNIKPLFQVCCRSASDLDLQECNLFPKHMHTFWDNFPNNLFFFFAWIKYQP